MSLSAKTLATLLVVIIALAVMIIVQQEQGRKKRDDKVYQIKTEVLLPATTPVPAPQETSCWVRYDVPLEDELQQYIGQVCRDYGVPTEIVLAVIDAESDHDAGAIGDGGRSYGLMQIMASEHTARCVRLNCYNLLDERQNVLAGVDFLAELWADYGDWGQALRFYHGEAIDEPSAYADAVLARAEILAEGAVIIG